MSLEMWSPPSGRLLVCHTAPSRKRATSVVPPPRSIRRMPELLLLGGDHRLRRGQRLEHEILHLQPGAVDAADHVAHRGRGPGDEVHLHLEPHPGHAERLLHPVLVVHHEGLGQHVDDLAVLGQVDRAGRVERALDVGLAHLAVLARDRHHAAAVDAADVAARHPRDHRLGSPRPPSPRPRATACLMDSTVESMLTTTPLRSPREGLVPTPTMSRLPIGRPVRDDAADLGRPHVEPGDDLPHSGSGHGPSSPRHGLENDLIAEAQVDRAHRLASRRGPARARPAAGRAGPPSPPRPGAPRRRPPCRARGRPAGSRRSPRSAAAARSRERSSTRSSEIPAATRGAGVPSPAARSAGLSPVMTGASRHHRPRLRAQVHALLVDPVQPARVDEREGPPLFHHQRDPVREAPHHVGAPHERQRLRGAPPPRSRSSRKRLMPGPMPEAATIVLRGEPARPHDRDLGDREARRREQPADRDARPRRAPRAPRRSARCARRPTARAGSPAARAARATRAAAPWPGPARPGRLEPGRRPAAR